MLFWWYIWFLRIAMLKFKNFTNEFPDCNQLQNTHRWSTSNCAADIKLGNCHLISQPWVQNCQLHTLLQPGYPLRAKDDIWWTWDISWSVWDICQYPIIYSPPPPINSASSAVISHQYPIDNQSLDISHRKFSFFIYFFPFAILFL